MDIINVAKKRGPFIRRKVLSWASSSLREFPWRKQMTPYSVLIAEFLLKRTTATAVNRLFMKFLAVYPVIEELVKADVSELEELLKPIGYNKMRSLEIKKAATFISKEFKNKIPNNMDELLSIPYVGPYTSAAVLSLGYGVKASMVDSNVLRVIQRVFVKSMPSSSGYKKIREITNILLPDDKHAIFNLALIDLGGLICTYRKYKCDKCPIKQKCDTAHAR